MTLGIAASRSTSAPSRFASRRGAKKLMKSATPTASGTAMMIAIVEDRMVPKARGQT